MDTLVLRPQPWANGEDLDDEVRILVNGDDLVDLVTVAEQSLATAAGRPSIADSYSGLRPAEVLWPSHHLLGATQAMWQVCREKTALLRCRACDADVRWPVLARIEVSEHAVVWRDFEQRRCPGPAPADTTEVRHDYPALGPYRFSRLQYEIQVRQVSTTTVFHPVRADELPLIEQSDWRRFSPRLPDQPVFTLALTWDHARRIADAGSRRRSVIRCSVRTTFLNRYQVETTGGIANQEYRIPADDLDAFNAALDGPIEVVDSFGGA